MNRLLTLTFAGAGTLSLILAALVVYPSVYAYYIYPQTQSTSMYLERFYGYGVSSEPPNFNGNYTYFHITEALLQQYPQLQEGFQFLKNDTRDHSAIYSQTGIRCAYRGDLNMDGGCNPIIPFKMAEVPQVKDVLQMDKYDGRVEYNGENYRAFIAEPDLKPVYTTSLLFGIVISIIGSAAIWLVWARLEGKRNRENDMPATDAVG